VASSGSPHASAASPTVSPTISPNAAASSSMHAATLSSVPSPAANAASDIVLMQSILACEPSGSSDAVTQTSAAAAPPHHQQQQHTATIVQSVPPTEAASAAVAAAVAHTIHTSSDDLVQLRAFLPSRGGRPFQLDDAALVLYIRVVCGINIWLQEEEHLRSTVQLYQIAVSSSLLSFFSIFHQLPAAPFTDYMLQ